MREEEVKFVFTIKKKGELYLIDNVENTGVPDAIILYFIEQWLHSVRTNINNLPLTSSNKDFNVKDYGIG